MILQVTCAISEFLEQTSFDTLQTWHPPPKPFSSIVVHSSIHDLHNDKDQKLTKKAQMSFLLSGLYRTFLGVPTL